MDGAFILVARGWGVAKPFFSLILGMMLCGGSLLAQVQNPKMPPMPMPQGQQSEQEDPAKTKLDRELAKKANQERQAALRRDTEKLLKLATELKDYVDKTNESVLSLDVVKKAEEIEKLAHSVKEKMKAN